MSNSALLTRQSISLLIAAIAGLAVAIVSGLALVPRVRLVEVLTVIAGALGAGASFAAAVVQFKRARGSAADE